MRQLMFIHVAVSAGAILIGPEAQAQSAPQPATLENITNCSVEGGQVFITTGKAKLGDVTSTPGMPPSTRFATQRDSRSSPPAQPLYHSPRSHK